MFLCRLQSRPHSLGSDHSALWSVHLRPEHHHRCHAGARKDLTRSWCLAVIQWWRDLNLNPSTAHGQLWTPEQPRSPSELTYLLVFTTVDQTLVPLAWVITWCRPVSTLRWSDQDFLQFDLQLSSTFWRTLYFTYVWSIRRPDWETCWTCLIINIRHWGGWRMFRCSCACMFKKKALHILMKYVMYE